MPGSPDSKSEPSRLLRALRAAGKEPLGDAFDLLRLLWTIEHDLQVASRQTEAKVGVTGPQLAVLRYVGLFPGLSPSALAEILQLHPSTLSGVFKRLVAKSALERHADPSDGRRVVLRLTDVGRELITTKGHVEAALERVVSSMPSEKVRAAEEVLQAIARELEAEIPSPVPPGE